MSELSSDSFLSLNVILLDFKFFFTSPFLFDVDEQVLSHGLHVYFNSTRSTKGKKKTFSEMRESARLPARSPARTDSGAVIGKLN